jgi:hypothetical protein
MIKREVPPGANGARVVASPIFFNRQFIEGVRGGQAAEAGELTLLKGTGFSPYINYATGRALAPEVSIVLP